MAWQLARFMKMTKWMVLITAMGLLASCVAPATKKSPAVAGRLSDYQKVKLRVTDLVGSEYSRSGVPMFEGLLKGKLQSLGLETIPENADLNLEVSIVEFDQGNRTLRTLVGMGAGRAVLKFNARFLDSTGKLVAEFEGGKAYHGMELTDNATFKSDESTRMGLISHSVSQIGEFITKNGKP